MRRIRAPGAAQVQGVKLGRRGLFCAAKKRDNLKPVPAPATRDAKAVRLSTNDVTQRRQRPDRWAGLAERKVESDSPISRCAEYGQGPGDRAPLAAVLDVGMPNGKSALPPPC